MLLEHLFKYGENLFALRHAGQIANQNEVIDVCVQRREDGCLADALKHHTDDAGSHIFHRSIRSCFPEYRSGRLQRQSGQRLVTDVLYLQIDV